MYIQIDRKCDETLMMQVYRSIRENIMLGRLKANEKLPSTRRLSEDIGVSRIVVLEAYDQLLAEGYIYSIHGSGSFISEGVDYCKESLATNQKEVQETDENINKKSIQFKTGVPDLAKVPIKYWGKTYKEMTLEVDDRFLDYQNPMGSLELRSELSKYLRKHRGVVSREEDIIITTGAAQAFGMLRCLLEDEDYATVENPSSDGLITTLVANNIPVRPTPIDQEGLLISELPTEEIPKLIFTTPSHQFPLGSVMSAKRRVDLIKYAVKNDCYIVEDDYDSEFRFEGSPIRSMQSIEPTRVIYIGTFSKTFSPAIRLAYMIMPKPLVEKILYVKYSSDIHTPMLEQLTMAKFIKSGQFERHIYKMKRIYNEKRKRLVERMNDCFGKEVEILGDHSGLHLVIAFKSTKIDDQLIHRLNQEGVKVKSLASYYVEGNHKNIQEINGLVIGYGNVNLQDIDEGVKRICKVIKGDKTTG